MNEHNPAWVCPWQICNEQQAQECRAQMSPVKGCGGRFPKWMTPAQAAESIKRVPIIKEITP